jgi:hypothetical protein
MPLAADRRELAFLSDAFLRTPRAFDAVLLLAKAVRELRHDAVNAGGAAVDVRGRKVHTLADFEEMHA